MNAILLFSKGKTAAHWHSLISSASTKSEFVPCSCVQNSTDYKLLWLEACWRLVRRTMVISQYQESLSLLSGVGYKWLCHVNNLHSFILYIREFQDSSHVMTSHKQWIAWLYTSGWNMLVRSKYLFETSKIIFHNHKKYIQQALLLMLAITFHQLYNLIVPTHY